QDQKKNVKETRACFHCGKAGHLKKDCRFWKQTQESEKDKSKVTVVAEQDLLVVLAAGQSQEETYLNDEWIVDSAASYHAAP
ncbi:hypothetical protein M569_10509, partial [Genlisea aurea]